MIANRRVPAWQHGCALLAIVAVYGFVATRNIGLPGIYADAINPDYLVNRILNPDAARSIVWILLGNSLLGDRAPVLVSLYHGSQQFWLGLPLYAIFGTTVEGVRLVHATFALGVLLSMYALLQRVTPVWLAAVACCALALDPAFSFSFRTQAYITVAPAAWIFIALWSLLRAGSATGRAASQWLLASGFFCGLASVGYFVWAFVLPPIAVAAVMLMRGASLHRPAWLLWGSGLIAGAAAYPLGYLLVVRKAGSVDNLMTFLRQQQAIVDPLRSEQGISKRMEHIDSTLASVLDGSWHSAMMFNGDALTVPGATWKLALLVLLPLGLWAFAEIRRNATPAQRVLVALPMSFAACALVFGDRLGGHHFSVLVPLLYAAIALGLASLLPATRPAWVAVATVSPLLLVAALNGAAQIDFGRQLVATGGRGLLSDAIHRFAADINRASPRPLLWFPDAVLALPLIMLSHGEVEMTDQFDDLQPGRQLCAGRDVWMVRIPNHPSTPRGEAWLAQLRWPGAPRLEVYADRMDTPVFEVLRFQGDAAACPAGN